MLYRNHAVTIARTGGEIIFVRDDDGAPNVMVVPGSDVGCLDATNLIATGSVRKSTAGDYAVADYVRRDAS